MCAEISALEGFKERFFMSLMFVSHSLYSTWPVLPQVLSGASARIDAKNRIQGASFLISVGF